MAREQLPSLYDMARIKANRLATGIKWIHHFQARSRKATLNRHCYVVWRENTFNGMAEYNSVTTEASSCCLQRTHQW